MAECGKWIMKCINCNGSENNYITFSNEFSVPQKEIENENSPRKAKRRKITISFRIKLIRCQEINAKEYDCESFKESNNRCTVSSRGNTSPDRLIYDSTQKSPTLSHCSELNYSPDCSMKKAYYKFCCPICFKYFTNIYVSKCCKNYYCYKCHQSMKCDAIAKGGSKLLRCIFCGQYPLHFEKVNPNDTVISYKNSPLKALQSKLSISGLIDSDSKQSSDK